MLLMNNPQAAKAILDGRRHDNGLRIASVTDHSVPNEVIELPAENQILVPRLSELLPSN